MDNSEQLIRYLELARQDQYAELWLAQKLDPPRKQEGESAYRLLGLNPPSENAAMGALINGGKAALLFEDEDDNSFHASNPDHDGPEGETVSFILCNGQRDEYPAEDCLPVEQAVRALLFYFEHGEKPGWIHWQKDPR